jgi:hypothetical protein
MDVWIRMVAKLVKGWGVGFFTFLHLLQLANKAKSLMPAAVLSCFRSG